MNRIIKMQIQQYQERENEKFVVVVVVVFKNKKTLSKNSFSFSNKFKYIFVSNLVDIVFDEILFKKKRHEKLYDSNEKKKRFRESNINYFNSHYFKVFDKDDLIIIDDKTYYRNV